MVEGLLFVPSINQVQNSLKCLTRFVQFLWYSPTTAYRNLHLADTSAIQTVHFESRLNSFSTCIIQTPATCLHNTDNRLWLLISVSDKFDCTFYHKRSKWEFFSLAQLQPSANLTSILCYFALIMYDPYVNRVRTSRPPCCGLLVNVSPTLAHPNLWANVVLALCQPHTDFGQIVPILSQPCVNFVSTCLQKTTNSCMTASGPLMLLHTSAKKIFF